jgi:hypothetical protein
MFKTSVFALEELPMPAAQTFVIPTYVAYLVISIALTIWVARTLHKNGRAFLIDAFHGQENIADSVNRLLVVGFYLINLGWIVRTLQTYQSLSTPREAIELLSNKVGTVLFVLGIMHFFNLYVFNRIRRRALDMLPTAPPPVPPTRFFAPAKENV